MREFQLGTSTERCAFVTWYHIFHFNDLMSLLEARASQVSPIEEQQIVGYGNLKSKVREKLFFQQREPF